MLKTLYLRGNRATVDNSEGNGEPIAVPTFFPLPKFVYRVTAVSLRHFLVEPEGVIKNAAASIAARM